MNALGLLKFNHELSFTNLEYHAASGSLISWPPGAPNRSTWTRDIPEAFKQETLKVVRNTYGKDLDGLTFESWRMCW
jgi:hypothetical protein